MKAFERETVIAWSDEDEDDSGVATVTTFSPRWQRFFTEQGYTATADGSTFEVPIRGISVWPAPSKPKPMTKARCETWLELARTWRKMAKQMEAKANE